MRLFRGRRAGDSDPAGAQAAPERAGVPERERRRTARGGAVVTFRLRPAAMFDRPSRSEIDLAGSTIAARLREEDGFDLCADGAFEVTLANCDAQTGRVVASRIASEITLRSAAINRRKWVAELVH